MKRAYILPMTLVLLFLTILVLFGLASTLASEPIALPSTDMARRTSDTVESFYLAANEVLNTGNTSPLYEVISADFREYAAQSSSAADIDAFVTLIEEIRQTCPRCRFQTEIMTVGYNEATVRVTLQGVRRGRSDGVSVDGLALDWSAIDVLHTSDGRVVARWSHADPLSLAEPLFTGVDVDAPAGTVHVEVARLILPPGASLPPVPSTGPTLLIVEAGELRAEAELARVPEQRGGASPIDTNLTVGDQVTIAAGSPRSIKNEGTHPAVILMVEVAPN